jgi:hypothetical protein
MANVKRADLKLDPFVRAYLECALWTSDPEPGSGEWSEHDAWTIDRIPAECIKRAIDDCSAFRETYRADLEAIGASDEQNGHDFWLTRNRHGAGFWDRGYDDTIARRLTDGAHAYGDCDVYSARGWIYLS